MRCSAVSLVAILSLTIASCAATRNPPPDPPRNLPPHEAEHAAVHEAAHDSRDEVVETVYYRAGEGFVPTRLDIETGTRVVLINESGEEFAPLFAAGHADSHSGGHADHHGAHGDDHHSGAPAWTPRASHADGHAQEWTHAFHVSGYRRYRNDLNPDHTGLIVALDPPGSNLEPLVVEGEALSFPEAPELTADRYDELLRDTEAVREFMHAYGPHNTLEVLRQAEVATGVDCHGSAHHLGRMTFSEYGAAASVSAEEACRSGMRHGMLEQLFVDRGIGNLAQDVGVLCPPNSSSFVRHQCLHGVGHGVMAWTAYEIEDALMLCDRLSDQPSQSSCYTGVFMENVVSGLAGEVGQRSTYVDREDPHYPCNALDARYVDACYWYQTSQMLNVFNRDLDLVAQACEEAPPASRRTCFGSYGRDVTGMYPRSPRTVAHYCSVPPTAQYRLSCIDGAARTLFWDESQQDKGLALCEAVEDPLTSDRCYESIVLQAHAVVDERESFCSRIPEQWRDWCLRK